MNAKEIAAPKMPAIRAFARRGAAVCNRHLTKAEEAAFHRYSADLEALASQGISHAVYQPVFMLEGM